MQDLFPPSPRHRDPASSDPDPGASPAPSRELFHTENGIEVKVEAEGKDPGTLKAGDMPRIMTLIDPFQTSSPRQRTSTAVSSDQTSSLWALLGITREKQICSKFIASTYIIIPRGEFVFY